MSKNLIKKFLLIFIPIIIILIFFLIFRHTNSKDNNNNELIIALYEEEEFQNEGIIEDAPLTIVLDEVSIEDLDDENTAEVEQNQELGQENINTPPYYIKVNYLANTVTIYTKDENNQYTIPYKAMICSTGTYTPTSGIYAIPQKIGWCKLEGDVYGQYSTQIKGNILFHSVPYLEKNNSTLEYWEYDKLGTSASAGCIRLTVSDAKWIYSNCKVGTKVEFYADSNPGPLGKPSAQKISNNVQCRGWDPTDSDPNNPWHTYSPEDVQPEIEEPIQPEIEENIIQNNIVNNTISNTIQNNNIIINNTVSINNDVTNSTEENIISSNIVY